VSDVYQKKPLAFVILDGFGWSDKCAYNAIQAARMPFFKAAYEKYPSTLLRASGAAVGLSVGSMGNSEVGHVTLGSGQVVPSVQVQADRLSEKDGFMTHAVLQQVLHMLVKKQAALHLIGLLSDGGVHSHERHLYALLRAAQCAGLQKVYIHCILDGRDTASQSASQYLSKLDAWCMQQGFGEIASIQGRFFAMDRNANWERTHRAIEVFGDDLSVASSWRDALEMAYANGCDDEFIEPVRITRNGVLRDGDGIVFWNTRSDRARQITRFFVDPSDAFVVERQKRLDRQVLFFVSLALYDEQFAEWGVRSLVQPLLPQTTLLAELEAYGESVACIAETEKYAHITYFFDRKSEVPRGGQQWLLIPSQKVRSIDQVPDMSAENITSSALSLVEAQQASILIINYANADMVGHSGNFQATVRACERLDIELRKLYASIVRERGGILLVTADHGNAEDMYNEEEKTPKKAHTTNPVPFVCIAECFRSQVIASKNAGLSAVAPTILQMLGYPAPECMDQPLVFRDV